MPIEKCCAIIQRDTAVIAPTSHLTYFPLVVERAAGCFVFDADGNRYLDFISSASSMNLGGCHPAVVQALHEQAEKCLHYTAAYSYNEPMVEYARRLASVYPGHIDVKVCFGNSGSDANDAAIKFARAYTGRSKIIAFQNGYHGSTYGAVSLSCVSTRMRGGTGPFVPDIYHFPFWGTDRTDADCEENCLRELENALQTHIPAAEIAAVILEPMQGDGGQLPAHPIFMRKLFDWCKRHGVLLFTEEVQQGFFRAGKWFSIENYGVVPDGVILGKSAGGGLPLGALVARSEILDALPAPAHLFTLTGNPLSCAAGIAQFDVMASPAFQAHLRALMPALLRELDALCEAEPLVSHYSGMGVSYGLHLRADARAVNRIVYRCYALGLITISIAGNILRIQPPLIIEADELAQGFAIIRQAIADEKAGRIPDSVLEGNTGW